jgi:hypothetical protein
MERSKKMTMVNLSFKPDDTAKPELIKVMLDELGSADEEERGAIAEFCETTISAFSGYEDLRDKQLTMGDLQIWAAAFADGYSCGRRGK